jgi:hypothetical protein
VSTVILVCVLEVCLTVLSPTGTDAAPRHRKYVPVYAPRVTPSEKYSLKTLKGDFVWATRSSSIQVAADRWKSFLDNYAGPDREYEDGFDTMRVKVAKYELVRIYYLLGKVKDGDAIFRQLDPLELVPKRP